MFLVFVLNHFAVLGCIKSDCALCTVLNPAQYIMTGPLRPLYCSKELYTHTY